MKKLLISCAGSALLAFFIGVGATAVVRFWRIPATARHEVASRLSDDQPQAAEIIKLPERPEQTRTRAALFDFEEQVGVAEFRPDGFICLTIPHDNLGAGSKVLLAAPVTNKLFKTVVVRKLAQSCSLNPDTPVGASFYSLALVELSLASVDNWEMNPLVGLVGVENFESVRDGSVGAIDLDRDGRREYFRDCTSMEGVHLTIWSGKPLTGKRLWTWYYYLGYDVVPDCTEKDYTKEQD